MPQIIISVGYWTDVARDVAAVLVLLGAAVLGLRVFYRYAPRMTLQISAQWTDDPNDLIVSYRIVNESCTSRTETMQGAVPGIREITDAFSFRLGSIRSGGRQGRRAPSPLVRTRESPEVNEAHLSRRGHCCSTTPSLF